jgi:ribonuclease R
VHRQLHKYYFAENYNKELFAQDELTLEETAGYISEREREIMAAEYEVEDMKKAEYMLKYQNHQVSGTITAITEYGFYVELENTIEGFVHVSSLQGYFDLDRSKHRWINYGSKKSYKLGQRVDCLVKRVDKDERQIDFEVIEQGRKRKRYSESRKRHPRESK